MLDRSLYSFVLGSCIASSLFAEETKEIAENGQKGEGSEEVPPYRTFVASQLKDPKRVFMTGEVLFWKASEDQVSYAVSSSSTSSIRHGHVQEPNFNWDWGFRVGAGYNIPHDQWDIYANYTQFHSQAHGSSSTKNGAIFPTWQAPFAPNAGGYATEATSTWRLHLNIADLELGRPTLIGRFLCIRPFVGVRGAWIYQRYEIDYKGGTAVPFGDTDQVNMRNQCFGVGGRVGADTLWGLGKGISIFGDGAFSLLSGYFNIHQTEHLEEAGTTIVRITNNPNNSVMIAELSLGFQYDKMFARDHYHLGIKLGYEFNYFWDQNRWIQFLSSDNPGSISTNSGNLALQGVTFGFRFDF